MYVLKKIVSLLTYDVMEATCSQVQIRAREIFETHSVQMSANTKVQSSVFIKLCV